LSLKKLEREIERDVKLAELQTQAKTSDANATYPNSIQPFRIDTATKMLPKLKAEHDIETYLIMFEKTARMNSWPQDKWAAILQTQLRGKALKVFTELRDSDCQDFSTLKKSLLTAYEFCPEVYRQKFRKLSKTASETHSDFAFRLTFAYRRWLQNLNAYDNLESVREVFLMEQFLDTTSVDPKLWLTDRQPKSLEQMARLADEYLALRKSFSATTEQSQPLNETILVNANTQNSLKSGTNSQKGSRFFRQPCQNNDWSKPKTFKCFWCNKPGHRISECKQCQRQKADKKKINTQNSEPKTNCLLAQETNLTHDLPVHPLFKPYCTTAHIIKSDGSSIPIQMLRDTGALQSVLSRSLDESHYTHTGETRLIKGISKEIIEIPLVELHLRTASLDKQVLCGLVSDLPEGVDLLFGNDLAYLTDPSTTTILEESVITRAQAIAYKQDQHQHQQNNDQNNNDQRNTDHDNNDQQSTDTDIADTVHENSADADDELLKLLERTTHTEDKDLSLIQSREQLISLQKQDRSLAVLFKEALEKDFPNAKPYYYIKDGMLMHHDFQSKTLQEVDQVVVPESLRCKILFLARDIPASGHLGIAKTKNRLWPHFYWPRMSKHVCHYCKSCDQCQRLGKGRKPSLAPLMPLPVMTEPWSRIAIDIVGPLPTCDKSQNRFVLTVLDLATHYPEAIALTDHRAPQVAKALSTVFCRFGFCQEILSDQGTDFMSEVMKYFLREFNISHIRTSPYHPQTNGSCERFHRTMKSMIRSVSDKFENSWDECLPWILFAYREIPVQSLGFSPFEQQSAVERSTLVASSSVD